MELEIEESEVVTLFSFKTTNSVDQMLYNNIVGFHWINRRGGRIPYSPLRRFRDSTIWRVIRDQRRRWLKTGMRSSSSSVTPIVGEGNRTHKKKKKTVVNNQTITFVKFGSGLVVRRVKNLYLVGKHLIGSVYRISSIKKKLSLNPHLFITYWRKMDFSLLYAKTRR